MPGPRRSRLSERFFHGERIPADGTRFVLRISDGRFSGIYNDGLDEAGEWYVGWSGTTTVRGDQIELQDPRDAITDTLRVAVTGDQLTMTPLAATRSRACRLWPTPTPTWPPSPSPASTARRSIRHVASSTGTSEINVSGQALPH